MSFAGTDISQHVAKLLTSRCVHVLTHTNENLRIVKLREH